MPPHGNCTSQKLLMARSIAPAKLAHGIPTAARTHEKVIGASVLSTGLDLLLQSGDGESLHNCLSRPCFHLGLLSEHHAHTCLCGWLQAGLNAAHAWECEDARCLHFLCCNGHHT